MSRRRSLSPCAHRGCPTLTRDTYCDVHKPEPEGLDWTRERKMRKEMSEMDDIFQVDYLPEKGEIRINLPEEVWENLNTIIMTRVFQEELVVEKQKEGEEEQ